MWTATTYEMVDIFHNCVTISYDSFKPLIVLNLIKEVVLDMRLLCAVELCIL